MPATMLQSATFASGMACLLGSALTALNTGFVINEEEYIAVRDGSALNFAPLILLLLVMLALAALFLAVIGALRLIRRRDRLATSLSYAAIVLGAPFLLLGWYWLPFSVIVLPCALFSVAVGRRQQREAANCQREITT